MQRRPDRRAVFDNIATNCGYLAALAQLRGELDLAIYGYSLMPNHSHVIAHAGAEVGRLDALADRLARFVQGSEVSVEACSPWHRCSKIVPIESDEQLLACGRYIELNPVKAGLVRKPEDFEWSSYRERVGLRPSAWLDADPSFWKLGENERECRERYRQFVEAALPENQLRR